MHVAESEGQEEGDVEINNLGSEPTASLLESLPLELFNEIIKHLVTPQDGEITISETRDWKEIFRPYGRHFFSPQPRLCLEVLRLNSSIQRLCENMMHEQSWVCVEIVTLELPPLVNPRDKVSTSYIRRTIPESAWTRGWDFGYVPVHYVENQVPLNTVVTYKIPDVKAHVSFKFKPVGILHAVTSREIASRSRLARTTLLVHEDHIVDLFRCLRIYELAETPQLTAPTSDNHPWFLAVIANIDEAISKSLLGKLLDTLDKFPGYRNHVSLAGPLRSSSSPFHQAACAIEGRVRDSRRCGPYSRFEVRSHLMWFKAISDELYQTHDQRSLEITEPAMSFRPCWQRNKAWQLADLDAEDALEEDITKDLLYHWMIGHILNRAKQEVEFGEFWMFHRARTPTSLRRFREGYFRELVDSVKETDIVSLDMFVAHETIVCKMNIFIRYLTSLKYPYEIQVGTLINTQEVYQRVLEGVHNATGVPIEVLEEHGPEIWDRNEVLIRESLASTELSYYTSCWKFMKGILSFMESHENQIIEKAQIDDFVVPLQEDMRKYVRPLKMIMPRSRIPNYFLETSDWPTLQKYNGSQEQHRKWLLLTGWWADAKKLHEQDHFLI